MVWVRLDDQFHSHEKVAELEPDLMLAAVGLHALALSWCGDRLTDGMLPKGQPARLAGRNVDDLIAELVRVGLWERTETGYQIHDYLDYNPSREEVNTISAVRSEAGKRGAESRWQCLDGKNHGNSHGKSHSKSLANTMAKRCPEPEPVPDPVPIPEPVRGERAHARVSPEELVDLYHRLCPSLPRVRQLTDARRRRLQDLPARLGDVSVEQFFARVEASDFLTGRNNRGWRADIDWILKPEHVVRILEGTYDNREGPAKANANVIRALELVERCEAEEVSDVSG